MADEIRIVDTQAAIWAKEATLVRLYAESAAGNKLLEKFLESSMSKEQLASVNQVRETIIQGNRATAGAYDVVADRSDRSVRAALTDLKGSLSSSVVNLRNSLMGGESAGSIVGNLSLFSRQAGKSITEVTSGFGVLTKGLGAVTGGMLSLVGIGLSFWNTVSGMNKEFMDMYESGVRFNGGLQGVARAAGDIGISTSELSATFVKFGASVSYLGTDRTIKLTKRFSELNRESGNLMMTNAQAAEAVLEYTEMMKSTGTIRGMTDDQLIAKSQQFYGELNQLSVATGRNRKELQKSIEAQVKDLNLNVSLQKYTKDQQDAVKSSIKAFQAFGQDGAKILTDVTTSFLATGSMASLSSEMQTVIAQSGLQSTFATLSQKMLIPGADLSDEMSNIAKKFSDTKFAQTIALQAGQAGAAGDAARKLMEMKMASEQYLAGEENREKEKKAVQERANKAGITYEAQKANEDKKRMEDDAAFLKTQNALNDASKKLQGIYNELAVGVLTPLLPGLTFFGQVISLLATGFKKLADVVETLTGGMTNGVAGSIAAGAAGYGAYRGAKSLLFGKNRDKAGSKDKSKGGESSGGGGGGAVGETIEALASAGPTIGPALTSLAGGLASFANPTVLGGALGFAASIAAIVAGLGAGIAVASYLIGKSLPTLAEGLKSFTDIDGESLGSAALGITKLSGALTLFAGSQVVGVFGAMGSWFSSFFQTDPLAKFQEFAKIGEPLSIAGESMRKFAEIYPTALEALGKAKLDPAFAATMDQIKSILGTNMGTWLGGSPAIIGQINDLSMSIGKLASDTSAFNVANANRRETTPEAAVSDLSRKTLEHYTNTQASYASMIQLLETVNSKLDAVERASREGTTEIVRKLPRGSNMLAP